MPARLYQFENNPAGNYKKHHVAIQKQKAPTLSLFINIFKPFVKVNHCVIITTR
jgi:hypothetical protein